MPAPLLRYRRPSIPPSAGIGAGFNSPFEFVLPQISVFFTSVQKISAIVVAGGTGSRFGNGLPKQFARLGDRPILAHTLGKFQLVEQVAEIVAVVPTEWESYCRDEIVTPFNLTKVARVVTGGATRQESVARGLAAVAPDTTTVLVHDGVRPLVSPEKIAAVCDALEHSPACLLVLPVQETLKEGEGGAVRKTLERQGVYLAQTPQGFHKSLLAQALAQAEKDHFTATDDAALVERLGVTPQIIAGEPTNLKITTSEDLAFAERLFGLPVTQSRVGFGYDSHRLVAGRPLILGGVTIPFEKGLAGHSDADVLCHAFADALLGSLGLGDIGSHFPDTEEKWRGVSSLEILRQVAVKVAASHGEITSVDATVVAEKPRLGPYIEEMREKIAQALGISATLVSIKAKTAEGLGSIGAGEAMATYAVAAVNQRKVEGGRR